MKSSRWNDFIEIELYRSLFNHTSGENYFFIASLYPRHWTFQVSRLLSRNLIVFAKELTVCNCINLEYFLEQVLQRIVSWKQLYICVRYATTMNSSKCTQLLNILMKTTLYSKCIKKKLPIRLYATFDDKRSIQYAECFVRLRYFK